MTVPSQPYDLLTEPRVGYLFANARAAVMTPDLYLTLLQDIRKAVIGAGTGRLLFEYEIAHTLTEAETLELMNEMTKVMPGMRIAIVARDSKHRPSVNFSANVGLGAGYERRSFADPTAAEQWLLED